MIHAIVRKYKRWRARHAVRRLRDDLLHFNEIAKRAGFTRHERRALKAQLLKDIRFADDLLNKMEV